MWNLSSVFRCAPFLWNSRICMVFFMMPYIKAETCSRLIVQIHVLIKYILYRSCVDLNEHYIITGHQLKYSLNFFSENQMDAILLAFFYSLMALVFDSPNFCVYF
jgi:hypothetical protein